MGQGELQPFQAQSALFQDQAHGWSGRDGQGGEGAHTMASVIRSLRQPKPQVRPRGQNQDPWVGEGGLSRFQSSIHFLCDFEQVT